MGWPSNPHATDLDDVIDVDRVSKEAVDAISFSLVESIPRPKLQQFKRYAAIKDYPPRFVEMVDCVLDGRHYDDPNNKIVMAEVTSVSQRQISVELARAAIPVEGLIAKLVEIASTGRLNGRDAKVGEQLDALKFLTNKSLPDRKSEDAEERAIKVDRKKAKLEDMTEDELKKMTADELRELIHGGKRK